MHCIALRCIACCLVAHRREPRNARGRRPPGTAVVERAWGAQQLHLHPRHRLLSGPAEFVTSSALVPQFPFLPFAEPVRIRNPAPFPRTCCADWKVRRNGVRLCTTPSTASGPGASASALPPLWGRGPGFLKMNEGPHVRGCSEHRTEPKGFGSFCTLRRKSPYRTEQP